MELFNLKEFPDGKYELEIKTGCVVMQTVEFEHGKSFDGKNIVGDIFMVEQEGKKYLVFSEYMPTAKSFSIECK